ncbi:MAG: hypothetical protein K2H46_02545 [Muribaculaceae bacterium]|nr:hypothetical protein [Muribaculaceae bacterium]
MKIETKFSLNQEVWAMKDNRPYSFRVWDINVATGLVPCDNYGTKVSSSITYRGYGSSSPWYYENSLFATKEELLASL